ncbi:MAG: hypothetical protein KA714_22570 [Limnoraphis sp. WC205]|nr:hypothetical protein [Limnoraphis sp. WC205]
MNWAIALLFIISLEVSVIADKTIHLSKPDYDFKKAIAKIISPSSHPNTEDLLC